MTDDLQAAMRRIIGRIAPAYRDSAREDLDRLQERGVRSLEDIVALLHDASAGDDRARACWILGRLGDERALDHLTSALRDPDPHLRAEAARSLGALGSPHAVPALVEALRTDADQSTRVGAAHSLGLLGDDRAVEPLLDTLADRTEDPQLRGVVAEALTGPRARRAVPQLIAALEDPSVEVRFWAAFALGELGDPAAVTALERLAQTDSSLLPGWRTVKEEAAAAIDSIRRQHD